MARFRKLWLVAVAGALLALIIELVSWLVPQLLKAIREPAYLIQFCVVLGVDTDTASVTIGFEYPCYYKGSSQTAATLAPPPGFNGLYVSFLVAICLIAFVVFTMYMANRLPTQTATLMPTPAALIPQAPLPTRAEAVSMPAQPIGDNAAEALRQTDENLKKRIIALATKVENERDARMELEQRLSQTLEIVEVSRYQQSPLRRSTRGNAVGPFGRQSQDV